MEKKNGLWLNLGCSDDLMTEFINVDKFRPTNIEQRFDFQEADLTVLPWPWESDTVDYILAKDIIEHLPNKILTMNEAWRILKPEGVFNIEIPTTDGRGAFQDPTHVSFWNLNSFFYFANGNPHRERFGDSYGVKARFNIVRYSHMKLEDEVIKLHIVLRTVK